MTEQTTSTRTLPTTRTEVHPGWCDPLQCQATPEGRNHASSPVALDLGGQRVTVRVRLDLRDGEPAAEPLIDVSVEDLESTWRTRTNVIRGVGHFEPADALKIATLIGEYAEIAAATPVLG